MIVDAVSEPGSCDILTTMPDPAIYRPNAPVREFTPSGWVIERAPFGDGTERIAVFAPGRGEAVATVFANHRGRW